MGTIHRRIERLESAAGGGSFNLVEILRDLNRRDTERGAFCANATEAELIAKLCEIDADEAQEFAELASPPEPPTDTELRWWHDLHYNRSRVQVRESNDSCDRAVFVAALAGRMGVTVPPKPTASHNEQLWPANWAGEVISETRAQLSDGSPLTDAIVAALHKRIG
jgi:hypothetical protein